MTIQEFTAVWQAQPFRAFRLKTARGDFEVTYPLATAMTVQARIAVVGADGKAEIFSPDEITACEAFGPAVDLATAIGSVAPETLARNAQVLASAAAADEPPEEKEKAPKLDAGSIAFLSSFADDGVHLVHAAVSARDGKPMFSTIGTRWNLHGVEQFENGTSLYLHHRDHPLVEQRIILWPPDKGTFESFAEAKSLPALAKELHDRDAALAARPAKPVEPDARYFREIRPEYVVRERDHEAEAFGGNPDDEDPDRYELVLEKTEIEPGETIFNPRIYDNNEDEFLFDLTGTAWFTPDPEGFAPKRLKIRHHTAGRKTIELRLELETLRASIGTDATLMPLAFIERHLGNFVFYEAWDEMLAALRAGPADLGKPDVVFPGPEGFRIEMWSGDRRWPLPFLQPHITRLDGTTVFDLRATPWAAMVRVVPGRRAVTLRFVSNERESAGSAAQLVVTLDLVTLRVALDGHEGTTSLGMLQALVRHVRGVQWMQEELPKWFEKGKLLPPPVAEKNAAKKRVAKKKK